MWGTECKKNKYSPSAFYAHNPIVKEDYDVTVKNWSNAVIDLIYRSDISYENKKFMLK